MRTLLLTNAPTPYRLPLFAEINRQLQHAGIGFRVVFAADGYARRKWDVALDNCGFEFVTLRSRSIELHGDTEQTMFSYAGLMKTVDAYQPAVVIVSGFSMGATRVWLRSKVGGPPYLIWSGSVAGRSRYSGKLRTLQRRLLTAGASGAIAYGSKAADYLSSLGMPGQRIFTGINTVDTSFFTGETEALRRTLPASDGIKVLTYVGYLSARKNVGRLFEVVRQLAQHRSDFILEIVGDGDERQRLEAYVAAHGLDRYVRFYGYRQQHELPAFYARSSCLLYQTDFDIWGLVLVEAMAAGVACAASINAGATADLIEEGVTGFAVDFNDVGAVVALVNRLLDDPALTRRIGQNAREFIADNATIAKSAAGFVSAVTSVVHAASPGALCDVTARH